MRRCLVRILLSLAAVSIGCSDESSKPTDHPPTRIGDLRADASTSDGILLTWTAPADDGDAGRAASYEIRWSNDPFPEADWETANPYEAEPAPGAAASPESLWFHGGQQGLHYFFRMRSIDSAGNQSALSNETGVLIRYPERTRPENLIEILKIAYNDLNVAEIEKLFDPGFRFDFAAFEVGQDGIPRSWGVDEEIAATRRLFTQQVNREEYRSRQIILEFQTEPPDTLAGSPDTVVVGYRSLDLTVECRHATTEEWLWYVVQGDEGRFYCVATDTPAWPGGPSLWRLVRWEDLPLPGSIVPSVRMTWSRIKWNWLGR